MVPVGIGSITFGNATLTYTATEVTISGAGSQSSTYTGTALRTALDELAAHIAAKPSVGRGEDIEDIPTQANDPRRYVYVEPVTGATPAPARVELWQQAAPQILTPDEFDALVRVGDPGDPNSRGALQMAGF